MDQTLVVLFLILADIFIPWFFLYPVYIEFTRTKQMMKNGRRTQGVIVDFTSSKELKKRRVYAPVVTFTLPDGAAYTVQSKVSTQVKPVINKTLDVYYDANDPASALIDPETSIFVYKFMLLVPLVILIIANVCVIIFEL